jgi:hypothetical protein
MDGHMKTYSIQGLEFTLLPTTPKNRRALINHEKGAVERIVGQEYEDVNQLYDARDMELFERFKLVTSGPHDQLVFDEFDIQVAEEAIDDFLPQYVKTTRRLAESLA